MTKRKSPDPLCGLAGDVEAILLNIDDGRCERCSKVGTSDCPDYYLVEGDGTLFCTEETDHRLANPCGVGYFRNPVCKEVGATHYTEGEVSGLTARAELTDFGLEQLSRRWFGTKARLPLRKPKSQQ